MRRIHAAERSPDQSSSMSIAMVPSGPPSVAWMALGKPVPPVLPANRLRLRMYSLCLTCFFALISTSLPRLALFVPAYERLAAALMLDLARGVRTPPPPLALAGILEPPRENAIAEGVADEEDAAVAAAAARCAPSLAMMREREMRGFRACACSRCCSPAAGLVNARSGLAARTAAAAAASEVGRTGGGMTGAASSGVVNILAPAAERAIPLPPRGLFVIASRAELCGGVLARCATMLLILDLATAPVVAAGLRVLARELAVGANSLDVAVALLGLNMFLLLPSPALSSSALFAIFVAPGPLFVGPGTARRCEPADNEFVADERGRPASTLRRELVDAAGVGFKGLTAVLLDKLADRGSVGTFLLDRESNVELGGLERDDCVPVVPTVAGALLDADTVRVGFRPIGASDGRDAGRDGFLESPGFAAMLAVCDLVAAVVVVVVAREAFSGEPAPKFHTLRTIDLAEEKNPKRGFALPLSVRKVAR